MKRNIVETRHGEISFLDGEGQIPVVLLHGLGGMGNVFLSYPDVSQKNTD